MGVSVNDLSSDYISDKIYSKYSNKAIKTDLDEKDTGYLDFDGYLTLLRAQMSNQDFNNSMSDSEFVQQMASYSMMEAISQMTKQNALTYSSSLIGKAVTVTDSTGTPDSGLVEAVTITKEGANVLVNGKQYSVDKVTDVIDGSIYTTLNAFTGHKVEIEESEGELITGTVKGVYISNGKGYILLDNKKTYDLGAVRRIVDDEKKPAEEGTGTEGTESAAGAENAAGAAGGEASASASDENAAIASVENAAAASYMADRGETDGVTFSTASGASLDALMRILDGEDPKEPVSGNNLVKGTAEVDSIIAGAGLYTDDARIPAPYVRRSNGVESVTEAKYASASNERINSENIPVNTAALTEDSLIITADADETPVIPDEKLRIDEQGNVYLGSDMTASENTARSGLYSDMSKVPAPSVYNQYIKNSGVSDSDFTESITFEEEDFYEEIFNDDIAEDYEEPAFTGSINKLGASSSKAASKATYDRGGSYGTTSVKNSSAGAQNLNLFAESASGMSYIPSSNRKYAEDYPLEAAFADTTGTHMADIRFIGNTDIMDRVDTSEVICYSQKGRPVCEIGWCGKGRLGEVVTFADGRQRVEIILGSDVSYYYTTGKYTLNQLINGTSPTGRYSSKDLTPEEVAIAHYGREYTKEERAAMKQFSEYAAQHAARTFR